MTNVSHPRYTDGEAQNATDGKIDADTVDGKHATDLGASFATENGSYSAPSASTFTQSITFTNAYNPNAFIPVAMGVGDKTYTDDNDHAGVSSLSTDANGNVTGMTLEGGSYGNAMTVYWYIMGEPA